MKKRVFPYIPHTDEQIGRMCEKIGVDSVNKLLEVFPEELRIVSSPTTGSSSNGALNLPEGMSEQAVGNLMREMSEKNSPLSTKSGFLGAGAYNHYIPSAVDQILLRSELYTSYTPYQPELSQGTLQAVFEYQTLVCQLTGMELANASLYDGASAVAEAALMAKRVTRRKKVLLSSALHPEYRETTATYLRGSNVPPDEVMYCTEKGTTLAEAVARKFDEDTACLVVQYPNFFGSIEELDKLAEVVHAKKGLLIVVVSEALSMGLLTPPGELGADIVVGEGQSFGNPVSYGGPYLGFMGTKTEYARQLPGRIIGQTKDRDGKNSFCLTLATREQHIRRERATSNICTNQGLVALACAAYLMLLGRSGLMELARINFSKAVYMKEKFSDVPGVKVAFVSPSFNEFVIEVEGGAEKILDSLLTENIVGGLGLKKFYPELDRHILITVTEMNPKEDIDKYVEIIKKTVAKAGA